MAERPVYIPLYGAKLLVATKYVEFEWHPGMAPSQRRKSVVSLHGSAREKGICTRPLEVSSKSQEELGVRLSAFNLAARTEKHNRQFTVETAYQSSKIFKNGGPYKDLLYVTSIAAKKDPRLNDSGDLIGFRFFGEDWPLEPKTAFYDWLYLNTLQKNPAVIDRLQNFDAFTDIEFNPKRSINCQAYSVALFKALDERGLVREALASKQAFLDVIRSMPVNNSSENTLAQPRLV